jgi:hypothetical protein
VQSEAPIDDHVRRRRFTTEAATTAAVTPPTTLAGIPKPARRPTTMMMIAMPRPTATAMAKDFGKLLSGMVEPVFIN